MAPIEEIGATEGSDGYKAPAVPVGEVLPGSAEELKERADAAAGKAENQEASRLYTMALDVVTKKLKKDKNGRASRSDLQELNKSCDGMLAKLLSNRSMTHLRVNDLPAAIEDAETCTHADPSFEKGHMRLLVALDAAAVPLPQQLAACEESVGSCPHSQALIMRKWKLKKAVAEMPAQDKQCGQDSKSDADLVAETRRMADDTNDTRRAMAAADLGSLLATGSRGLAKDVDAAERYLRIGAEGGDLSGLRNLGHLLLELGRPAEAAEAFREGSEAGDEQATEMLKSLLEEAAAQQKQAREKLEELAANGDPRAIAMLKELDCA